MRQFVHNWYNKFQKQDICEIVEYAVTKDFHNPAGVKYFQYLTRVNILNSFGLIHFFYFCNQIGKFMSSLENTLLSMFIILKMHPIDIFQIFYKCYVKVIEIYNKDRREIFFMHLQGILNLFQTVILYQCYLFQYNISCTV